ncbi:28S ribosomal protein S14, mitochondrial [Merluccius polli]|uniref:28S ribosomal protein S14, mitochondrial n=1 Tax=Merluccius polli TaxID=89951 RepID=A0AA47MS61_MERPO|nr:28S ribosomal protein S14, mitochondrial [Merluccius polli]
MLRDVKRRQMAFDYADQRVRINALRKNTILPKELQVKPVLSLVRSFHNPVQLTSKKEIRVLVITEVRGSSVVSGGVRPAHVAHVDTGVWCRAGRTPR